VNYLDNSMFVEQGLASKPQSMHIHHTTLADATSQSIAAHCWGLLAQVLVPPMVTASTTETAGKG
jgi:hypothetical protein